MTFKKSASPSEPPKNKKPDSYRRSRTLKRGCSFKQAGDEDMKWLWAAYKRGVFSHLPEFPDGMGPFDFQKTFLAILESNILGRGGDAWIYKAHTPRGEIPIGLVIAIPNRGHVEPHQFWFPEASPRNRLECSLKWLIEAKKVWKVEMWVRASKIAMFEHLCRYGVIRTIGKYRGCFDDGEDGFIYQSVHDWKQPPAEA